MTEDTQYRISISKGTDRLEIEGDRAWVERKLTELSYLIGEGRAVPRAAPSSSPAPVPGPATTQIPKHDESPAHEVSVAPNSSMSFEAFAARHKIPLERLHEIVDLHSGEILVSNLGQGPSEMQWTLASLLAIVELNRSGKMAVDREELKERCKAYGFYDADSFSTYMRRAKQGNSLVFLKEENGWRVVKPGEPFVADRVLRLLNPPSGA